jgi:hypothetical protein
MTSEPDYLTLEIQSQIQGCILAVLKIVKIDARIA